MLQRALRRVLVAALMLAAPGPETYSALAAVMTVPGETSAPLTPAAAAGPANVALPALDAGLGASELSRFPDAAPLTVAEQAAPLAAVDRDPPRQWLENNSLPERARALSAAEYVLPRSIAHEPPAGPMAASNPRSDQRSPPAASPLLSPSDPESQARAPTARLLADPGRLELPALGRADAPATSLRLDGQRQMDVLLGTLPIRAGDSEAKGPEAAPAEPPKTGQAPAQQKKDPPDLVPGGLQRYHRLPGGSEEVVDPMYPATPDDEPAHVVLETPEQAPPARLTARVARWLASPFRVLPDKERNQAFWRYVLGQALLNLGIEFHYNALNGMVAGKDENSPRVAQNRALNWGAAAASTLTTGPLVDRSSIRITLSWTYLARSLLMMSVPVLFLAGYHVFAVFQATLFISAFIQNISGTASSVAFQRILANDEEHYDKANAIYMLTVEIVGVVAPLLAGSFIGYMDLAFGRQLIGNALAYGVYGIALLALAVYYYFRLHIPRDEMLQVRRELLRYFKKGPGKNPRVRNVSTDLEGESPVLVVHVTGDPQDRTGIPTEFGGYPVEVKAAIGPIKEMVIGFRLLWQNRFLRITTLLSTPGAMTSDALIFAALPIYIKMMLDQGVAIGWWPALATLAGLFGIYRAASSLGGGIPTFVMSFWRRKAGPEPPVPPGKLDRLERRARFTSILYALGSVFYAAVFFVPNLWVSVAMIFLSSFLEAPAMIVWGSVHQKVMQQGYPAEGAAMVYSAQSFYGILCEILGLLLFGGLMVMIPSTTLLWVAGGALVGVAAIHAIEPFIVFPLSRGQREPADPDSR